MVGKVRAVCGFMFGRGMNVAVFIRKLRPAFLAGKLNGVGGKVEEGESVYRAMAREFEEETEISTDYSQWREFCTLDTPDWDISFLYTVDERFWECRTVEKEQVVVLNVHDLWLRTDVMPNIKWLVPMAISLEQGETAESFHVVEQHRDQ